MKTRFALLPLLLLLSAVPAASQQQRDDLWVTNGNVDALEVHNNSLFVGGTFSRVGPATGSLAAVHATTGVRTLGSLGVNGAINVLVPDGSGGFYIGGAFTKVLGQTRLNAARIDAEGNLKPWNPNVDQGVVKSMALVGGRVYLGGSFVSVGGNLHPGLATVDTANGVVQPGNVSASGGEVVTMAQLNGVLYVGGSFTALNGTARNRIGALDANTGTLTAFNPNSSNTVNALAPYFDAISLRTTVYAGGVFATIGGQARANLAALDGTVGAHSFGQALAFNPAPNAVVHALAVVSGPTLYVAGEFTTIAGQPRNRVASFNSTPTLNAWNPNADGPVHSFVVAGATAYLAGNFTTLGGQPRPYAGAVNSSGAAVTTAWNPAPFSTAYALGTSGTNIWIGGLFASIGGVDRANLAEIDLTSGQATSWNPAPGNTVMALHWVADHLYAGGRFGLVRYDAAGVPNWTQSIDAGESIRALAHGPGNILYVGGSFPDIGGEPRSNVAAFSTGSPPALLPWQPAVDNVVEALAVDATHVYIGGWFYHIGAHATRGLGRVDFTGADQGWTAPAWMPIVRDLGLTDTSVFAAVADISYPFMILIQNRKSTGSSVWYVEAGYGSGSALSVGPNAILIGGDFASIGGNPRTLLAKVEPEFGLLYPWAPEILGIVGQQTAVDVLLQHNGVIYMGGDFQMVQGKLRSNLAGLYEATTAVDPAPRSAPIALRASPNPARGTQAFAFDLAAPAASRVTIHSVAGRVVRVLRTGILPAGPNRLEWDGRTDAGVVVAPGLYFVRLDSGETAATTKVLRID